MSRHVLRDDAYVRKGVLEIFMEVASRYAAFPPETALRLASRLEIHHTPKHGSWLNSAELELRARKRQCLPDRIPDADRMRHMVQARNVERNTRQTRVDWQFTAASRCAFPWTRNPANGSVLDMPNRREHHGLVDGGAGVDASEKGGVVKARATVRTLGMLGALAPWVGCQGEVVGTDDFTELRGRMVREQLQSPGRDIVDPRVLAAMGKVPRHALVPEALRAFAYDDRPLPIGFGQTISQPYIVAFMTQALQPRPEDRVLEVGTGSGYQAAVLAELTRAVYTIEIVAPLAERAARDLRALGYTNVFVRAGDGYRGWPEEAPFDAIIVTCAPERVPAPLVAQLRDGGRMIIPVGPEGGVQELVLLTKRGEALERRSVLPVRFVPMTGTAREPRGPAPEAP